MEVLIVDNLTLNSKYISTLLKGHNLTYRIYSELTREDLQKYDLYILTGTNHTYMNTIWDSWDELQIERELIEKSSKPIIGICYGAELIAQVFNSKIESSEVRLTGNYDIKLHLDLGLDTKKPYSVYANHRFFVSELSVDLEVVATSPYGYEAFKDKTDRVFGLMFHPEKEMELSEGDEIFLAIVAKLEQRFATV